MKSSTCPQVTDVWTCSPCLRSWAFAASPPCSWKVVAPYLGSLFDAGLVDRVVAFVAPAIIGGDSALSPVGGTGVRTDGRRAKT